MKILKIVTFIMFILCCTTYLGNALFNEKHNCDMSFYESQIVEIQWTLERLSDNINNCHQLTK
jgi:hypothetical protein